MEEVTYYGAVLRFCSHHRLFLLGRSLHRRLLLHHLSHHLHLSNHLINFYSKCNSLASAHRVFDEMPHRNLVSWTALISAYSRRRFPDHCFSLFSSMLSQRLLPNEYALSAVLSASIGSFRGRQVHALATKTSFDHNVTVCNALIAMYSKCPSHASDGWLVFRVMPFRNLITWNSVIAGFPDRSVSLFRCIRRNSSGFDRATLVSVITSCRSFHECLQMHCLAVKCCFDSETLVASALVKAYSGLGGGYRDCYRIFVGAKEKDIVSWIGIMASCVENEPKEAMSLFWELRWKGFIPDRHVLSIAVKACAGFATERHCSAVHSLVLRSGFGDDTIVANALIHAYSRCGSIGLAGHVFEQMVARDLVSWNSLIKALATHGRGREALQAFRSMDIAPDSSTFAGLLTACSHGGLLDEGREIFESLSKVYGIDPHLDHYACMVDILGRAGRLSEAEELIEQMPIEPDFVVWSSLLGACSKHREARIGEKAARKLVELDPQRSVGYVMMSNIYCARGSYHDATFVRKEMKEFGVKKELGLSWIGIGNLVHEFSAGGRHHPQIEDIWVELKGHVVRLKKMGYVADTSLVLHEIDEERKEERLLRHSEKLALVFGMMNSSAAQDSLKIMKNIRICKDCHRFMKLSSECIGKEIVVRDSSRFHHFIHGECSCGDYW
ncbi:pentatricopeptide repeat-containing protein [Iris pallida]|uniref:Pentatricopeptide repeat-containing protein n=1 Tax=Iris pallida TaxID=29817 RepID=A0AAX6HM09_IRIPA|nr:pentatricopeptide repeat-containing protein [Iris pallida]